MQANQVCSGQYLGMQEWMDGVRVLLHLPAGEILRLFGRLQFFSVE